MGDFFSPYVRLEVVAGPDYGHGGVNGANITVDAVGPHGSWQRSCGTELDSLRHGLAGLADWPRRADECGYCPQERELDCYTPLEGRFEVALLATPNGPALEARDTPAHDGIHPHTRVPVTPTDVQAFVDDLNGCLQGTALAAQVGLFPTEVAPGAVTRPLLHIGRRRVRRLDQPENRGIAVDAAPHTHEAAAAFLEKLADLAEASAGQADALRERITAGGLTLSARGEYDHAERIVWRVTIGSVRQGPAWSIRMSPVHCRDSAASLAADSLTLYGYVSQPRPL